MGKKKINSVKVEYWGHQFDSLTERDFFIYLVNNKEKLGIFDISVHPQYQLLQPFKLTCIACNGTGKFKSEKTGRGIQCKKCKGSGTKERQGTRYTADFEVIYENDVKRVFDVKGFKNERFPMYKKLFEHKYRIQLIEVYRDRKTGEWVYK